MLLPSDDAFVTFTLHSRTQQLRQGGLERHRLLIGSMLSFDVSLEDTLRGGRYYKTTFCFVLLSHAHSQAVSGMI